MKEKDLLLIGKVVKPHGIKGEIKVLPYSESVDSFRAADVLCLKAKGGPLQSFKVTSVRPHKNVFIVGLKEISSINEAEKWIGALVYRRKDTLPALNREEGEYYWHEIIGFEVRTNEQKVIGRIKHVFNTGSNDIFVVYDKKTRKEYLIPSTYEVIEKFDWENKILWITPLPGLLESS